MTQDKHVKTSQGRSSSVWQCMPYLAMSQCVCDKIVLGSS